MQGKTPYYLTKKSQKTMALASKFQDLASKGDGAVDKFLEKKRKKNASKDRKQLPWKRNRPEE